MAATGDNVREFSDDETGKEQKKNAVSSVTEEEPKKYSSSDDIDSLDYEPLNKKDLTIYIIFMLLFTFSTFLVG